MGRKKLLHASLSSFSPYSDETVEGQEVGNKVRTVSLGLGTSGTCIGCTRTKSSHTGNAKSLFTPGSQGSFGRPSTTLGRTRARSNASVPLFIADAFLEAFTTKVRTTHEAPAGTPPPVFPPTTCGLSILSPVTEEELRRTILASAPKPCDLDPVPTFILQEFVDTLLPFLTVLCNRSICDGDLPASQKRSILVPVLKAEGLDVTS